MGLYRMLVLTAMLSCVQSCVPHGYLGNRKCGSPGAGYSRFVNDLSEPEVPDVFHDLTSREINAVRAHLERTINLAKPEVATLGDPHIHTMWLEMPGKAGVLQHLDEGGLQPDRQARVMVFRGDLNPPVVQELVCGPLPNIDSCSVKRTQPFEFRPFEFKEFDAWDKYLWPVIHRRLGGIIRESYNASFDYENCVDDCLSYWNIQVSNSLYNIQNQRSYWVVAMYDVEYYSLFMLDLAIMITTNGVDGALFTIDKVWYAGQLFDNLDDFVSQYQANTINKVQVSMPTGEEANYSTLKPRQPFKPKVSQRPPELIEPDGKRYTITHRKVDYLDMWTFHYRISSLYGPVINDVRFNGERIVYEISVQELLAVYSGDNPASKITLYMDSNFLTGSRSKGMVKGADCPVTATMISKTVTSQLREKPATFKYAACVFEQNFGRPLRRHHSYSAYEGGFYGGMLDSALVVRSIQTVDNYDYIIDFKFHQNGALGVSVTAAGFIWSNLYTEASRSYGVKLTDLIMGPVHMHAFNFKVDLDINGTSNRYETIDLSEEKSNIRGFDPPRQASQVKITNSLKRTEKEAALRYSFDQPKYHIFHNDAARNHLGERKSYRLENNNMVKVLVEEGVGSEPGFSWARYQMAVTKHKDAEQTSSVPYNSYGPQSPTVNFQAFIEDDENIVDQDLVTWVTMGMHHVPSTEDLPTTPTAGKEASFYLHPYNYFPVCPSMNARDSVFIEHKDGDPKKGLAFTYPGDTTGNQGCVHTPHNVPDQFTDPDDLLATKEDNGVL